MQALLFIRQYACQGIKTAQVAAYVGVSRSSLESHFRRVRGCSVHDEILRFKLAAAANGLENTGLAIAEIARDCGFRSAQYLHTVFRREFGCTPRVSAGWKCGRVMNAGGLGGERQALNAFLPISLITVPNGSLKLTVSKRPG